MKNPIAELKKDKIFNAKSPRRKEIKKWLKKIEKKTG